VVSASTQGSSVVRFGRASRAIADQDLMREQQRFATPAQATGAQEYHKGDAQVDVADGGFAPGRTVR